MIHSFQQIIQNACGTIAVTHAILNNTKSVTMKDGSVIKNFYEKAKSLSPEERGKLLESDSAFTDIHQELALEGQTAAPDADENVNYHYVALTNVDGTLFELDGRKNFPVPHGDTSDQCFLADAAIVCKKFMARDPKELRFTILALTA
jgi:ubiquitin carboxyl-terminal hydrolase L3